MARLTTSFMSESVRRAIHIDIVAPTAGNIPEINKPYKTLYYLEGALGNDGYPDIC